MGVLIMSVKDRYFRVVDYERQEKVSLTEKQYLVYAYLLSISKWNPTESHYYVYKSSFLVKDACQLIGVSQPTWRKALEKLENEAYISFNKEKKYYTIFFDISWAKLDISLIKFLVEYSKILSEEFGGILPALYGVICRYWIIQKGAGENCIVYLSQLSNLFFSDRTKEHLTGIWTMLMLFKELGLMQFQEIPMRNKIGRDYTGYKIVFVENVLSKKILSMQNMHEDIDEPVEEMIKKIITTKNNFEEYYNSKNNNISGG